MKQVSLIKIQIILVAVMGALMAALLTYLLIVPETEKQHHREMKGYETVQEVSCRELEKEDAPIGVVDEYRFTLGEIGHSDTLMFYINHHNIEVYLAGECVYSVTTGGGIIQTTGGTWITVPLYPEDSGKEVCVVLSPLYRSYQNEMPDFLLGSEFSIYKSILKQALPEFVLSLCVVLAGVFLLCLAIYHSIKHNAMFRLYAIGFLAVSAGLWRFTYGRFAYLLFPNHTVLLYTVSIVSLMFVALSMLNCVDVAEDRKAKTVICFLSLLYCVVDIVQLVLQIAGIFDLRQMLKATHATIVLSAIVLCASCIAGCLRLFPQFRRLNGHNYSWLLGIGTMVDLLLYYFADTSVGMLFTLGAILSFSMLEGVRFLLSYTEQKHALEEMETQLAMSQITIMMSQIRSHFVFNILNAISGMCKYDPERADNTVVRFARYLRNNIGIMEDDKNIPFTTDLKRLEDYVILEQVRFEDKVEFYTDLEIAQFMIPPLILQPVVENAIKHGVSKKQTGGTIILRTRDAGDRIVIIVEDNGVGFQLEELEKEKSVGLRNIRFRLRHLVNGTLDIASEVGKGTTVTITMPKKEVQG